MSKVTKRFNEILAMRRTREGTSAPMSDHAPVASQHDTAQRYGAGAPSYEQEDQLAAIRVKVICSVTKLTAQCIATPGKIDRGWMTAERALYVTRMVELLGIVETIHDDGLHGSAVEQIIDLCLAAGDVAVAKRLVPKVRSDLARDRIMARYQLRSSLDPGAAGFDL